MDVTWQLDHRGYALLPGLLDPDDCAEFIALFRDDSRFRSTIEMERHAYGEGRYRYFAYPLPTRLEALRTRLYRELLPIARRWQERLGIEIDFPEDHGDFLARCHEAGQVRPTPLVLRYDRKQGESKMRVAATVLQTLRLIGRSHRRAAGLGRE